MKEIPLTQGRVAIVDDEDYEWLNQWKWCYSKCGYALRNSGNNKLVYMHRVIVCTPKGMDTDHINHNKLDNRRENIRVCTRQQNNMNTKIQPTNTSGYKGIVYITNKTKRVKRWAAQIGCRENRICIGYYNTAKEAAEAYDKKAKELFGDFAHLNFGES